MARTCQDLIDGLKARASSNKFQGGIKTPRIVWQPEGACKEKERPRREARRGLDRLVKRQGLDPVVGEKDVWIGGLKIR